MKQLNSLSIFFALILLLLTPSLAAAMLDAKTDEIPYQIDNSDRIVIGTVSKMIDYGKYTIFTITVNEWLYNPLPAKTIKVRTETGTNLWTEDEAEFTLNESVLIMLKDADLNKQLFRVTFGFPGKRPASDRDAVIKELKTQGKWPEENQTGNKTNETEIVENTGALDKQEGNQTVNDANDTKTTENTGTTTEKEENSNQTRKPNTTPFISPVWVLSALLGAVTYMRRTT
ncbi:hypothetical protein RG963_11565 [Methanosarcina sp. Z-7115]|uniref:Cell surface protein n=1 Tax=Methanosarcina baikalica TaxID=3073890 RepID=A0ABU2D347_9EURY|nr:hypothetical protein [Methanosarcina sp. Z-7115]MDR7666406.1 hypothetical protein [Methanosarcina sp. Z-7115]